MTEKKIDKMKRHFTKIHETLQDRVDEFQDRMQNKFERSKISKFISHLSEDRSSVEDNSEVGEKTSNEFDNLSIPSFVIDEPADCVDPGEVCKRFIKIEQGNAIGLHKSRSVCDLVNNNDTDLYTSSESCLSFEKDEFGR